MTLARQIRQEKQQAKAKRQEMRLSTHENFFQRKLELVEKEAADRDQRIREMEQKEAELLDKIKKTQGVQLKEFQKLEEAMSAQQISVKKRLQMSQGLQM